MKVTKQVVYTGVMGYCIGDALGVPVECYTRTVLRENPVTDLREKGMHNQPKGTWSDASSMVFCLMESLCLGYNLKDIMDTFVQWYKYGYWTPHGDVFNIDAATQVALGRYMQGKPPLECSDDTENSNGNGGLMWILPMAFYLAKEKDFEIRAKKISEIMTLTHRHPRNILASIIYVEFILQLLLGKSKEEAYHDLQKTILEHMQGNTELKWYSRILNEDISQLHSSKIRTSEYVVDSLEACIWSFLTNNDYKSTVLAAVNLGEDTNTIGALAGGLAGTYYGLHTKYTLPMNLGLAPFPLFENWESQIIMHDQIKKLAFRFASKVS